MMSLMGNFTGIGIKPQVQSAQALSSTKVRVTFNEPMENNSDLLYPSNYTLTPDEGSSVVAVTAVTPGQAVAPSFVDLILDSEMTTGVNNYQVEVDTSVVDVAGNPLDPAASAVDFNGRGTSPKILSVRVLDVNTLRVTFSEAVKQVNALNPDDALNPSNYSITGSSQATVTGVEAVTSNVVDLTVGGQQAGGSYTLTVENVEDLAGNSIL